MCLIYIKAQSIDRTSILEVCMKSTKEVSHENPFGKDLRKQAIQTTDENEDAVQDDVSFIPSLGSTVRLRYKGVLLWISTGKGDHSKGQEDNDDSGPRIKRMGRKLLLPNKADDSKDYPSITMIGDRKDLVLSIIKEGKLLEDAKRAHTTSIFAPNSETGLGRNRWDNGDNLYWSVCAERPARGISSVVLPGETAQALLKDCFEFLKSEQWYSDRGIPYRRGYLLHGEPGCGKVWCVCMKVHGHMYAFKKFVYLFRKYDYYCYYYYCILTSYIYFSWLCGVICRPV